MSLREYLKRGIRYVISGVPQKNVTANICSITQNELLKNKTALVTGGTSGIGLEITKAFLRSGASVVFTGRNKEKINKILDSVVTDEPSFNGRLHGILMDNTDVSSFEAKISEVLSLIGGKLDVLVNNAGILGGGFGTSSESEFDKVLDTNLKGAFFLSQIVARHMKANSIRGNILNIASSSSLRPANSAYTLSKWGIRGLTLGMAKSLIPYGIVVNGIAPGPTKTPMLMDEKETNIANDNSPLERYVMPEEIANMAVIMVSDMGRSIVGDIVYMTGGAGIITFDDINYSF